MTQYQQVIEAVVNKLNGRGTTDEIFKAIDGIKDWKTKTPKASVAMYLSTSNEFIREGNIWIFKANKGKTDTSDLTTTSDTIDIQKRGLYFITLNPIIKPPIAGLLFKIGKTDDIKARLRAYRASLPYNPILQQSFYRIPSDVNLDIAETQVRNELLGNDSFGFKIERYSDSNQFEWLQTLDLTLNEEDVNKLAAIVNKIVKETIDNLRTIEEDVE